MRRWLVSIVVVSAMTAWASPSRACLWGPPPKRVDPRKLDVIAAERALAGGDHEKAVRLAKRAAPGIVRLRPADPKSRIAGRAQRTLALAAVRSGGSIAVARGIGGDGDYPRQVALAWAELTLTWHAALASGNLLVRSQLAEALAADPYQVDRAREMLRELADRDVMPTAQGYAVLARLESETGRRDTAIARCEELGGATVCRIGA